MTSQSFRPLEPAGGEPIAAAREYVLEFHDLLASGQAVARAGGLVVFAFGPLPGERARVRVETVKKNYAVARLVEIVRTAPERAEPFCKVFGRCGGCQLQHWSYPAQLNWKRELVRNALRRIGGLEKPHVLPTIGMPNPRAYRNKMSLVVCGRKPKRLGFYEMRSHRVVPIDACPITQPELDRLIVPLTRAANDPAHAGAFHAARHVVVRSGDKGAVCTIATPAAIGGNVRAQLLQRELPGVAGVANSFAPRGENTILGTRQACLTGTDRIEQTLGGLRFRASSAAFFQVNTGIVEEILRFLSARLPVPKLLVDLYCGVGTFAIHFASRGARVVGLEWNRGAIADARSNAALNGLARSATFLRADVESAAGVPRLLQALAGADAVFLDPARRGCSPEMLARLAEHAVANIWYLSCEPATLARDVRLLEVAGYRFVYAQPFDMFAQTGHVETLAVLERSA